MLYTIAAVLVLVLDQAVKFWTVRNIAPMAIEDATVKLIPGVIHMTNVQNNGAAFSILADQRWLLVGVSAVFIIGIIVLISMDIIHTKFGRWTAVLVMAGALGNCIDRVLYGYVVDMFEVELFSFTVFNVADIFITVCGILFCIHVIVYREPAAERNAVPRNARRQAALDYDPEEDEEEDEEEYDDRPARRPAGRGNRAPAQSGGRGRSAKAPKEDPYANIPRRGQHRSLEEELRLQNPDDPFAEWDFDAYAEPPAPEPAARHAKQPEPEMPSGASRRTRPSQAAQRQEAPAPQQAQRRSAPPADQWDESDLDMQLPARRSAPAQAPAQQQPAARRPAPKPARPESLEEYSLEDILAEFRDD